MLGLRLGHVLSLRCSRGLAGLGMNQAEKDEYQQAKEKSALDQERQKKLFNMQVVITVFSHVTFAVTFALYSQV